MIHYCICLHARSVKSADEPGRHTSPRRHKRHSLHASAAPYSHGLRSRRQFSRFAWDAVWVSEAFITPVDGWPRTTPTKARCHSTGGQRSRGEFQRRSEFQEMHRSTGLTKAAKQGSTSHSTWESTAPTATVRLLSNLDHHHHHQIFTTLGHGLFFLKSCVVGGSNRHSTRLPSKIVRHGRVHIAETGRNRVQLPATVRSAYLLIKPVQVRDIGHRCQRNHCDCDEHDAQHLHCSQFGLNHSTHTLARRRVSPLRCPAPSPAVPCNLDTVFLH